MMNKDRSINVTESFVPNLMDYHNLVAIAFENKWLTNRGELVRRLEGELAEYLNSPSILCTNNGTIPIQIALKKFGEGGEVITTPFSFVATTSSIVWEGCIPRFADIESDTLTIDPKKVEELINDNTTCILATHVYGNPCDVEALSLIAEKYGLKIIYDAAHCFGVRYNGKSIFSYGDVSTCSFHATKLFHTGEGGAIFCSDKELFNELYHYHNFGFDGPASIKQLGTNAKMSELSAAMGLAVLPHMSSILENRKMVVETYLNNLNQGKVNFLHLRTGTEWNYSYFPVFFKSETELLSVMRLLNEKSIYPRRYFFPSLTDLPYLENKASTPVCDDVSRRVLCLPLSHNLEEETVLEICKIINEGI